MKYYIFLELGSLSRGIERRLKAVASLGNGYERPYSYHTTLVGYRSRRRFPVQEFLDISKRLKPVRVKAVRIRRKRIDEGSDKYLVYVELSGDRAMTEANRQFYRMASRYATYIRDGWRPARYRPHVTLMYALSDPEDKVWSALKGMKPSFSKAARRVRVAKVYSDGRKPKRIERSAMLSGKSR